MRSHSGNDKAVPYGCRAERLREVHADCAAGQLTVVLPECDMVVSVNAGLSNMQTELSLIWDHLLPGVKDAPLAEGVAGERLRVRLANLAIAPVAGTDKGLDAFLGHHKRFKQNGRGIKSFQLFDHTADGIMCQIELPAGDQRLPVGIGEWKQGEIGFDVENYEGLGLYIGRQRTAASCESLRWFHASRTASRVGHELVVVLERILRRSAASARRRSFSAA